MGKLINKRNFHVDRYPLDFICYFQAAQTVVWLNCCLRSTTPVPIWAAVEGESPKATLTWPPAISFWVCQALTRVWNALLPLDEACPTCITVIAIGSTMLFENPIRGALNSQSACLSAKKSQSLVDLSFYKTLLNANCICCLLTVHIDFMIVIWLLFIQFVILTKF